MRAKRAVVDMQELKKGEIKAQFRENAKTYILVHNFMVFFLFMGRNLLLPMRNMLSRERILG
jgi:hypothetical protein